MKVLMISREYPPHIYGGAGVHVEHLARELARVASVEVRVFGEDRKVTEAYAREVAGILDRVPGVVDVKSGVVVSGSNVAIVPGAAAARAGLSAGALSDAVTPAVAGLPAGQIVRGVRAWPVRVVLAHPASASAAQGLVGTPVPAAPGRWVMLGDLASLDVEPGETEIAKAECLTLNHRAVYSLYIRGEGYADEDPEVGEQPCVAHPQCIRGCVPVVPDGGGVIRALQGRPGSALSE